MRTSSRSLLVLAALVAMLAVPTAAVAYAPGEGEFITCAAGGDEEVDCVAGPYDENTPFTWEAEYNPVFASGSGVTNDDGEAEFSFDASEVPEGSEITVTVAGVRDGEPVVLADEVAEVDEDGEVIANAGADSLGLVGIAAAALALGGGILAFSRRRSTTDA